MEDELLVRREVDVFVTATVYQYSGRDGKQTVDTEEEMEDELLVRREVDVFVTATDNGVFIESYNFFWVVFRLTICMSKFLRFALAFLYFLSCECETGP